MGFLCTYQDVLWGFCALTRVCYGFSVHLPGCAMGLMCTNQGVLWGFCALIRVCYRVNVH